MSGLTFDPEHHVYRMHGRIVPGVTTILRETGISTDFNRIRDLPGMRRLVDNKCDLGTALHADAHAYDEDALDQWDVAGVVEWPKVHEEVRPYLRAWIAFRTNIGIVPLSRERQLYHPTLVYCGTLDGTFLWRDRRVLVDLKTGDPKDAAAHVQTAAYKLLWDVNHPTEQVDERWSVQLDPKRSVPYLVTRYLDLASDTEDWIAALRTYRNQAARRKDLTHV